MLKKAFLFLSAIFLISACGVDCYNPSNYYNQACRYNGYNNQFPTGYAPNGGYYPPQGGTGYYPPTTGGYYPPTTGGYYPPTNGGYFPPGYMPTQPVGFYPTQLCPVWDPANPYCGH